MKSTTTIFTLRTSLYFVEKSKKAFSWFLKIDMGRKELRYQSGKKHVGHDVGDVFIIGCGRLPKNHDSHLVRMNILYIQFLTGFFLGGSRGLWKYDSLYKERPLVCLWFSAVDISSALGYTSIKTPTPITPFWYCKAIITGCKKGLFFDCQQVHPCH